MRPIPAPRLGDSHGLLRAISERERMRLDEFVTDFQVTDLFPADLENALGRTRQFVSFARSAGLVKEDRGTVELTEIGKRYVRAGDAERPFEVSEDQAEWLLRQLREKHMTDSIYHGLAIGLSLLASVPPRTRISKLDFGRSLGYLGRAGWDNENTLEQQGERYITLLADMGLIDEERLITPAGRSIKGELTLPVHMSLADIAANLNPGGADAVRAAGEAEWAQGDEGEAGAAEPEPAAAEEPAAAAPPPPAAAADEEDEYEDVGPGAYRDVGAGTPAPAAAAPEPAPSAPEPAPAAATTPGDPLASAPAEPAAAAPPAAEPAPAAPRAAEAAPAAPPAAEPAPAAPPPAAPPTPPADVWDTAEPDDPTRPYASVETPGAAAEPAPAEAPEPAMTSGDPLAAEAPPAPPRPGDAPTVISTPAPAEPPPPAAPAPAPEPAPLQAGSFLDANAIRGAAESAGLRLPASVYANVAAALTAGKHVVLTGPPGAGKTALALAIAKAAATSGRSSGAILVTAAETWTAADTLGRPATADEPSKPGHVVDAARRGKWLVVDELDRAEADRALGALSTFLDGLPVTIAGGEEAVPADGWRLVATAGSELQHGSAALLRRFAHVALPLPADGDLDALIVAAANGDQAAAGAARRLLALREVRPLGAGVFRDAARHAAERNAIDPADEATLAREAYEAYVAPLVAGLDEAQQLRLRELVERL